MFKKPPFLVLDSKNKTWTR